MPTEEEKRRRKKREEEEAARAKETAKRLGLAAPRTEEERHPKLSPQDRLELATARAERAGIAPPALVGGELLAGKEVAERQEQQRLTEEQQKKKIQLEAKQERGEVLVGAELEELKELAQIEELKEQVLQPDITLRYITPGEKEGRDIDLGAGYSLAVTDEEDTIHQTKRQISKVIKKNMNTNTNFIQKTIEAAKLNLATKGAKASFGTIDAQMQNLEGALVNHKEGAADVIVALQSGGYDTFDAMQDTNNMVQDVNDVEAMMKDVYLQAPSVWGEMKGWEYVSRLQKIRRAIIARQAQILNIAETGAPIDPGGMALALSNLQVGGS